MALQVVDRKSKCHFSLATDSEALERGEKYEMTYYMKQKLGHTSELNSMTLWIPSSCHNNSVTVEVKLR